MFCSFWVSLILTIVLNCNNLIFTGSTQQQDSRIAGEFSPSDIDGPDVFRDFERNITYERLDGKSQLVLCANISQVNQVNTAAPANIAVLPNLMEQSKVRSALSLLRSYKNYDNDPDTVDGMPTYEIFLDSPDLCNNGDSLKKLDCDPNESIKRSHLRKNLTEILQPINERITSFVTSHFAAVCNRSIDRSCTPCYSLIRKYRHGERVSHATHHDGHAIVTVVVSLSSYGIDYEGGLYVSTGYGQRKFLALAAGDAVAHQSTLLHGVKVHDRKDRPEKTERWSWILWYRDSTTCQDHSYEWFKACSDDGDAICQYLHATKVGNTPGISKEEAAWQVIALNRAAAEKGSGNAAIKMARAYLKKLPSVLPYNETEAVRYFKLAIQSNHPDGHYGIANLIIASVSKAEADGKIKNEKQRQWKHNRLARAIWYLEEAARLGHTFAMFNLGIAHVFGYGMEGNKIDTELASAWLVESGLPEGFYVASFQAASVGDKERQTKSSKMAKILGYFEPWRKLARETTGSGGASGVDLNLPWPTAHDGRKPPLF